MKPKVNNKDFIKSISTETGFPQKYISQILEAGANIVLRNLQDGIATSVFQSMVVYPSTYNNEITFPRARFGKFFKSLDPIL